MFMKLMPIVFLVLCLSTFAQPVNYIGEKKPKLEVITGDTCNWGRVSPKQNPLRSLIKIKNTGNAKLTISNVRPGCGCTTAPLDKRELEPGDTATMDVTMKITSQSQTMFKTIRIESDDPDIPEKTVYLKADIYMPIELFPTNIFAFGEMKLRSESSSTLKLKNNTSNILEISEIKTIPEELEYIISNKNIITSNPNLSGKEIYSFNKMTNEKISIAPGDEYEVTVKYFPVKEGYFNCKLILKTNNVDFPEFIIGGFGNIKPSAIFND